MPAPEVRFWRKVKRSDGCWLWLGWTNEHGYGQFWMAGRDIPAHRFSWELSHGQVPPGLRVLHRCDVPACVRPDHLFVGTQAENLADMQAKGRDRGFAQPGARNPKAKLSPEAVDLIRIRALEGQLHREIAAEFGVSRTAVTRIVNRRRWTR